jgi:hypothetical protein
MNLNDLFNEEKVRLDPACWHNKKIGKPKTKVKGGVRVNNCVPAESVAEAKPPGLRRGPLDLPPLEGPGSGGGSGGGGGTSPRWSSTKIPGVDIHTGPPPTVTKPPNINRQIDPVSDVPAYVRKGLPDPVTVPKPGTKPKITVRPGETVPQAMQRTKAEQEFGKFLQGQGGQSFGGQGAGRGTVNSEPAKQRVFPEPKTDTQVKWDEFKRKHGVEHPDKMAYDEKIAVDAMAARAKQSAADRNAKQNNKSDMIQPVEPSWKNRDTDVDLEEASRKKRKEPEVDYHASGHDQSVERLRHLAGLGPMKTVWDPDKRVYKNVPTADQPPKK